MRVAIDARTLQEASPGGVGRSLANLIPLLAKEADLVLLTDAGRPPVSAPQPQHPLRTPVRGVSASWLQLSAPRWLRTFDGLFHCPFYGLPMWLPVPGVVTLHDLTFEHFPDWYSRRQGLSFRLQARRAAKTARAIVTVSEFVKADIVDTYGVTPDRIIVAPHGLDPVFRSDRSAEPHLAALGVDGPYIVALGGAARRNVGAAIRAWQLLRRDGSQVGLVVVGGYPPAPASGLVHVARPPDEVWAAILAGALAFVYPTLYEGFGMPGLEALGAGTPVVAARVGSLPEVLGDAAAWSPTTSAADLHQVLGELLADDDRRRELRQSGLHRAEGARGWGAGADAHLEAYRRALE